ncbi:MAG: helix-turn-helix domain-containing protein [Dehalococcoidia bacterium]
MPVEINGQIYYRTAEVCQIVGIGKSTLFRWIRQNIIKEAEYRDRKGWRLFTEGELRNITAETSKIQRNHVAEAAKISSILR